MNTPANNRWLTPNVLLGVFGMGGTIIAAWISFDARLTRVEAEIASTKAQTGGEVRSVNARLDRIENKLDRVIERGVE